MIALVAVLATLLLVALLGLVVCSVWVVRRGLTRTADEQVAATLADRLMDGLYVERVVVTLRSGEAFSGLLADKDDKSLLLRSAESLTSGKAVPVDGELLIPRADVLYVQQP